MKRRKARKDSRKVIGIIEYPPKAVILKSATKSTNFGFSQSNVTNCCNGKQDRHHGYKWYYLDEYKKDHQ